ncbi:MAG: iron ABC transporter permease [Lachnospiraceae bacterium]|nr:iron ABC transporter permease [Lachnospiraceae bacterium]
MNRQTGEPENDRIHIRESAEEVSVFQKSEKKRQVKWSIVALLFLVYAGVFVASLVFVTEYSVSTVRIQFSLAYVLRIARQNINNIYQFMIGNGAPGGINFQIIRYLIVGLIGSSLAACGALLQGTFRNVLAGPSTLGIQSGGTLGNLIYVLVFATSTTTVTVYTSSGLAEAAAQSNFFQRNLQQMLVLGGCLFGVLLVVSIATIAGRGKISSSAMILSGTVFSAVIGSFCSLIQYYIIVKNPSDDRIELLRSLSMGSLDRAYSLEHLLSMSAVLIPCMAVLAVFSGKMNMLSFGEDAARSMGMNVRMYKLLMMGASTLMTAVVTAYVGHIGMIGFMSPQIIRRVVGPDFRRLFPASIAFGALLMTIIYDVARVLVMTDSLNLFTSIIGSFVMVFVLLNRKGGRMS